MQLWPSDNARTDPVPKSIEQHLARKNFIRRATVLLCTIIMSVSVSKFALSLLNLSSAWETVLACIVAFIAGAIALAGNLFTSGTVGSRHISYLIYFTTISVIVLVVQSVVGTRTVSGIARKDGSVTASDVSLLPFKVGVEPFAGAGCGTFIFDNSPENLKPIPNHSDGKSAFDEWLTKHDAVQSSNYGVRGTFGRVIVDISGGVDSPVTITGLSFRTLSHSDHGAHGILVSSGCGGGIEGRFAEINLDVDPPQIVASNADPQAMWGSQPTELTPIRFPYLINKGTSEVFYIMAGTKGNASFEMQLDYIYQDHSGSAIINNQGAPFRVGAPYDGLSAYQNSYRLADGKLIPPSHR